jgi:hypothetical protein
VHVEGEQNERWLLERLSKSSVFKSIEPMAAPRDSGCSAFRVVYTPEVTRDSFEKLLESIPEVNLMRDPA